MRKARKNDKNDITYNEPFRVKCGNFDELILKLPVDVVGLSDRIPLGDSREHILDLPGNPVYNLAEAIREAKVQFWNKAFVVFNSEASWKQDGETPVPKPIDCVSVDGLRESV